MATHYIDPVDGSDATGDDTNINTPRKTWPSTFTASDTYAQKGGTTATLATQVGTNAINLTFTSYGTGQAIIDGSAITATNQTIRIDNSGVTIDNLHIIGPDIGSANSYAVSVASAADNYQITNNTIVGKNTDTAGCCCIFNGGGEGYTISGNTISGSSMGIRITLSAATATVATYVHDNTITCVSTTNTATSTDGINVFGASKDWDYNLFIYDNDISQFEDNGIDLVGGSNIVCYGNDIHDNRDDYGIVASSGILLGATNNSVSGQVIRGNKIYNLSASANPAAGISSRGVTDALVYSNKIYDCQWGINNATAGSNNNLYFNNIISVSLKGVVADSSTTGIVLTNNIIIAGTYTIQEVAGSSITYSANLLRTGSIDGSPTDGGGNITSDPLLDSDYKPTASSPVRRAGYSVGIFYDYSGYKYFGSNPSIGAYEFGAGDAAASRTLATTRTSASTRTAATTRTAR